jgi:hypothetical protein
VLGCTSQRADAALGVLRGFTTPDWVRLPCAFVVVASRHRQLTPGSNWMAIKLAPKAKPADSGETSGHAAPEGLWVGSPGGAQTNGAVSVSFPCRNKKLATFRQRASLDPDRDQPSRGQRAAEGFCFRDLCPFKPLPSRVPGIS